MGQNPMKISYNNGLKKNQVAQSYEAQSTLIKSEMFEQVNILAFNVLAF